MSVEHFFLIVHHKDNIYSISVTISFMIHRLVSEKIQIQKIKKI